MKHNMITLIDYMSKDDEELFMNIIESHYFKFNFLYFMIKNELKKLKEVEYIYTGKKVLDVTLLFGGKKAASAAYDTALDYIENNNVEGFESELTLNNKSLDVHLKYDENEYDTGPRQPE